MDFSEFTLAAVLDDLERAPEAADADAIEFRMDRARNPLEQLAEYEAAIPLIATNRRVAEGGENPGSRRLEMLRTAVEHPRVGAVDVELATVETGRADPVLETCAETGTASIISWHDFEGTPTEARLERRLRAAAAVGTVGKAAVTATSPADVLALLAVTHRLQVDGVPVATMAMGDIGRHSRLVAPLYGSRIGYAPLTPAEASAPGQYDLATMRQLLEALR